MAQNVQRGQETHGYDVIDVDVHYLESYDDVAEYMGEPWKSRFKESGFDEAGFKQNASSFFPSTSGDRQAWGKIKRENSNYPDAPETTDNIREAMEFLGVDAQVLISHICLVTPAVSADDERVSEFSKGYTKYMRDEVLAPEDGIYGLGALPYQDIDTCLEVLEIIDEEPGYVGGCFIASGGGSPPLGHRKYDPVYEVAEKKGIPLIFHTSGSGLDTYSTAGYESFISTHTLGFMQSNQAQITSMIIQGVPERYPDLDCIYVEAGLGYLPALLYRLDEEYLKRSEEAPLLNKRPSEYASWFNFGTQPLEVHASPGFLESCFDLVGSENVIYCSDYPHWDFDRVSTVTDLDFLSEEEKQMVLADNARELFDL